MWSPETTHDMVKGVLMQSVGYDDESLGNQKYYKDLYENDHLLEYELE